MRDNDGQYPETSLFQRGFANACVLWGTDNIKTYGESLAFNSDNPGMMDNAREIFETSLKTAEVGRSRP
jgi:hypothetical protein